MNKINFISLPYNWIKCKLLDIGIIISGGTPSTKDKSNFGGDIPWITPADLSEYNEKYIVYGKRNITENGLQNSSAHLIPKGSILFSSRAPIGYVVIAANSLSTNQGFKNIIPSKYINGEYLYQYLNTCKQKAEKIASGTTFKEISAEKFGNLPFPLPPLPEQHRIVAKIDSLFSELDNGVAFLKTIKTQLAIYRQAVLQWAFEGFSIDKEATLSSVVTDLFDGPFGSNLKTSDYKLSGVRVIRLENVKSLMFNNEKKSFVSKAKYKLLKKNTVCFPDIIISTFISNEVKTCILPPHIGYAINKADCVCIRTNDEILSKFLMYYLSSKKVYNNLFQQVHGATRPRINTTQIKRIPVPICPKPEQLAIVSAIESRLFVCDKLEQTIDQTLALSASLRQSILKKAFEGRLVPQDPNDEPAEKLLERIKAEKAAVLAKQKQTRKRGRR